MTRAIERSIMTVGLDSEKRIFSEKMRRKGKNREKARKRGSDHSYFNIG